MTETHENAARALSFDLTTEPWIPVLRLNGEHAELSLRQVFEEARKLRRIVGDLPTQEFALLRLLLAVAHDALDGPRDTAHWGSCGPTTTASLRSGATSTSIATASTSSMPVRRSSRSSG